MTSVHHTSKGISTRQLSTTPAESFAQKYQHLKILAKKAINNDSSIPEGLNIKERICKLELMWTRTYTNHHRAKHLLQSFILRAVLSFVVKHGLQRKLNQQFYMDHTCWTSIKRIEPPYNWKRTPRFRMDLQKS